MEGEMYEVREERGTEIQKKSEAGVAQAAREGKEVTEVARQG